MFRLRSTWQGRMDATPYCHSERSEESSRQAKQALAKIVATIENSERKRATKQIIWRNCDGSSCPCLNWLDMACAVCPPSKHSLGITAWAFVPLILREKSAWAVRNCENKCDVCQSPKVFSFLFKGFPRRFTPRNDKLWRLPSPQCSLSNYAR